MKTGIYLHVPFCRSRCTYCDFNTYVGMEELYARYASALENEIVRLREASEPDDFFAQIETAHTIFIGGGTPSLLAPQQLGGWIRACQREFRMPTDAEVTVECNPGTVTFDYLRELRAQGATRLSFGAQSADAGELKLLGREHTFEQVETAVSSARRAGFENVNFDLIFGLPYQSLDTWRGTLARAMTLAPDHISLYALTIEQGTPMYDWTRRGEVPFPDPDLAADMYDIAEQTLGAAGYDHYEISNWCKPQRECAHNLIYWRNEPYIGLGAGAHSSSVNRRWWRVRRPAEYIARAEQRRSTIMDDELIDARASRGETMMLGLRLLNEGVEHARFAARYGAPPGEFFAAELARAEQDGLISIDAERILLTGRGRFVSNSVMRMFV